MNDVRATTELLSGLARTASASSVPDLLRTTALAGFGATDVRILPSAAVAPATPEHQAVAGARTVVTPRAAGGVDVAVPLMSRGLVHGVVAFTSELDPRSDPEHLSSLAATGAAIGLWCDLPGSGVATHHDHPLGSTTLTARQASILRLVEAGRSTDGIAASLKVSPATVKAELRRAGQALGAKDRVGIARIARQLGLLDDVEVPA